MKFYIITRMAVWALKGIARFIVAGAAVIAIAMCFMSWVDTSEVMKWIITIMGIAFGIIMIFDAAREKYNELRREYAKKCES